ncbi:MAG: pyrroline-5-carboxylate reductase [Bradymonadia bacterium]|jgi:pyrroline-5-carboxylate reductase
MCASALRFSDPEEDEVPQMNPNDETPVKGQTLGFIGCGALGQALLGGWLDAAAIAPGQVQIADPKIGDAVAARFGVTAASADAVVAGCDIVVLAVKPHLIRVATDTLAFRPDQIVISVCAGVQRATLVEALAPARVVRVMPNIAARLRASATLVHGAGEATDVARIAKLFDALGHAEVLDDERLFHVGTALVGSAPAFLFVALEALADGAVAAGMPRAKALVLAAHTMAGAAALAQDGAHPATLKDAVASPGGTTIQGLRALEAGGMRSALIEAIWAATAQSKALAEQPAKALEDA